MVGNCRPVVLSLATYYSHLMERAFQKSFPRLPELGSPRGGQGSVVFNSCSSETLQSGLLRITSEARASRSVTWACYRYVSTVTPHNPKHTMKMFFSLHAVV